MNKMEQYKVVQQKFLGHTKTVDSNLTKEMAEKLCRENNTDEQLNGDSHYTWYTIEKDEQERDNTI